MTTQIQATLQARIAHTLGELRAIMHDLADDDRLDLLIELGRIVHLGGLSVGVNLSDNYNQRTHQVRKCILPIMPDLAINPRRTGADAHTATIANVEIKTSKGLRDESFNALRGYKFMWDKQNDELRQQQTLQPQMFIFAGFVDEFISVVLIVRDRARIALINTLRAQQILFDEKWKRKHADGSRGYDSISLSFADIIVVSETIMYDLFIANTWQRSIRGDEVIARMQPHAVSRRKCSGCKQTGHTKKQCPGSTSDGSPHS